MFFDTRGKGAIRGPTMPRPLANREGRSVRTWHISLGIPFGLLALGVTLIAMGSPTFTLGMMTAYAGVAWLLFDWWFFSKELTLGLRLTGTAGTLAIAAIVSWVAFRPAPLDISFVRVPDGYADGVDVAGIKWSKKYSGLRLSLRNDSDFQYSNIDFLIKTDVMIAAVGFESKFAQCAAKPTLVAVSISGPTIGFQDKNGNTNLMPLNFTMADVFKVFCDKLLPHDPVEIVFATRNSPVRQGFNEASAVNLRGTFEGFLKSRPLEKKECLIAGCVVPDIP
jgi:hypothetical protein